MNRLRTSLRDFARDESGVMLAEFLMLFPLLVWGFIALVVYWDVFRTINVTQKAAYSISDLLSRQELVTEDFVAGLQNVLDFLTPGAPQSRMRITSFEFLENTPEGTPTGWGDDEYVLLWSRASGGGGIAPYTEDEIQDLRDFIPLLDNGQSALIVETWVDYVPRFDIGVLNFAPGISDQTFTQFIVTYPRRRRVCLEDTDTCV
jgi:hypothetical protein